MGPVALYRRLVGVSFAFATAATTGFDHVGELIRLGDFDRILLRPRTTVLMLLGHEFTIRRAGRFVQGAPLWIGWLSPLAGVAFLAVALAAWRYALHWYSSTGS